MSLDSPSSAAGEADLAATAPEAAATRTDSGTAVPGATVSDAEDERKAPEAAAPPPPPPPARRTVDWPLRGIKDPHDNDVLFGRGGGTNHHPGNKRYRKLVEDRKVEYVDAKRLDKPLVALDIIKIWRAQDPPGRFLKLDEKTGLWQDVGDKKAREKTSQALREKAPLIRKQIDEGKRREDGDDDDDDEYHIPVNRTKDTRFAEGSKMENRISSRKPILTRDHTLGREFIKDGEAVTLDGFSWQDSFHSGRNQSQGSVASGRMPSGGPSPPMPFPRDGRYPSYGSVPPPGPYGATGSDRFPSGRFESWGSNYSMPPPPMPGYGYPPPPHGSWGPRDPSWSQRDHSLCHNPLPYASVTQAAPAPYFDSRAGSWGPPQDRTGSWGPAPTAPPPDRVGSWGAPMGSWGPAPPPDRMGSWGPPNVPPYGSPPYYHHSGSRPHPPPPPQPTNYGPPRPSPPQASTPAMSPASPTPQKQQSPQKQPTSPAYSVDPKVASRWSGKDEIEIKKSMSLESHSSEDKDRFDSNATRPASRLIIDARPDLIKRATSNQNETQETKPDLRGPSVKRAALNRDSSAAANRLKEQYVPGYKKDNFNAEQEMRALSQNLEQSWPGIRPQPLTDSERMSTIDSIAMDLIVKPVVFSDSTRSTTIEALNIDLDDNQHTPGKSKPNLVSRSRTVEEVFNDLKEGVVKDFVAKPAPLTGNDRLTTNDYLAIIKEPIDDALSEDEMLEKPSILSRESSLSENWVT